MNMPPILSVIIPVYNVEAYLGSCIQSILNQTFSAFELILVDDGSSDASGPLCDALAATDARIRVIHKGHGGTSSARNAGIACALGEYIGFVDGDDWIEPDMYRVLYSNSVTYDADLSACGFVKIYNYDGIRFHSPETVPLCYTPAEALRVMFRKDHMRYSACNKLFRRQLFDTVRYPEGQIMEDKGTTYKLICKSNRVVWCASPKYHYFMRHDSIMHDTPSERYRDLFTVNEALLGFIKPNYPALTGLAGASYATECLNLLLKMKKSRSYNRAVFEKCMTVIRQNRMNCLTAKDTDFGTRLLLLLAPLFPWAFKT